MLSKKQLQTLKQTDISQIYRLLSEAATTRDLLFLLENLGHLPKDFNGAVFAPFLTHEASQVRYWAVKNIGKTTNPLLIPHLSQLARTDPDSTIRREAISAIGRMRLPEGIPTLIEHLDEHDPKVLLQVIRGLLVFRTQPNVQSALKSLANHPNEMIQSIIRREFSAAGSADTLLDHAKSPAFMQNVVVQGDVQAVLPCLPDESIHLTFTSPPYYNARDYSIYESYSALPRLSDSRL